MKWLQRNASMICIGAFTIVTLLFAVTIWMNGYPFRAVLFAAVSIPVFAVATVKIFSLVARIDKGLKDAKTLSRKLLVLAGAAVVGGFMLLLFFATGAVTAALGGVKFSSFPCALCTSFDMMHVVVVTGIPVLLLLAAGGSWLYSLAHRGERISNS